MRALLLVVAGIGTFGACGSKDPEPAVGSDNRTRPPNKADVLTGTVIVNNEPLAPTACMPGRATHVFVEVATAKGRLRFEDTKLYWNPRTDSPDRGAQLECTKLDRSWGGGNRVDGSSYWRGTLVFTCTTGGQPITGDLKLDCGGITADERAQLDKNRTDMLDEQKKH